MLQTIFARGVQDPSPTPQEGTLYKILQVQGSVFELYYGYYEERDRQNPAVEPMPIYPDFLNKPQYTGDGYAFVTKMQDACRHYEGKAIHCRDCGECAYYFHGQELLGICTCQANRRLPVPADAHSVPKETTEKTIRNHTQEEK